MRSLDVCSLPIKTGVLNSMTCKEFYLILLLMFRFNPKREDDITDEMLEEQSYDQPQQNQFQSHDIPEVIIEQVEDEEQADVNEDASKKLTHDTNEVDNAVRDRQNELLKQLESLKIQFQTVVQERNKEVRLDRH